MGPRRAYFDALRNENIRDTFLIGCLSDAVIKLRFALYPPPCSSLALLRARISFACALYRQEVRAGANARTRGKKAKEVRREENEKGSKVIERAFNCVSPGETEECRSTCA